MPERTVMQERNQSGQREGCPGCSLIASEVICHYNPVASGTCYNEPNATHCNEQFTECYFVLTRCHCTTGKLE